MKNFYLTALFFSAVSLSAQTPEMLKVSPVQGGGANTAGASMPVQTGSISPNIGANGNPSMGVFESAGGERTMDKIFDVNKDSFDLNEGAMNWKGKTFSLGDSRLARARFERYLATPVNIENFEKYSAILDEIEAQLTVQDAVISNEDARKRVRAAWSRLFDAAEYSFDGKSSLAIANVVAQSWRMKDDFNSFKWSEQLGKEELERRKSGSLRKISAIAAENTRMLYVGGKDKDVRSQLTTLATSRNELVKLMDAEYIGEQAATVAASTAARQAAAINAVFEFQSSILTFFTERKFQQAKITSMFYRNMFKGSRQDLQVGKEKVTELFGITNYIPQISLFESMATEARKDVSDGMKAVNYLYDSGQKYSALERLMETFLLGEFEPAVLNFPHEKKLVLLNIYKQTSTIKKLADAKDWAGIESIINDMKTISSDYPAAEILAKVKAAQRASTMNVMAARQAAATGNLEEIKKSLEAAANIWPLNPAIEKFNDELVGFATGKTKYTEKFDELSARDSYRDIAAEASEFGLALSKDAKRSQLLKDIITKVTSIDVAIAQAREMRMQRNPYAAWDILVGAAKYSPKDPVLAVELSSLAPEVSDYVRLLSRAQDAEQIGNFGASLNLFLAAKRIYPASQICRMGIERVVEKYME